MASECVLTSSRELSGRVDSRELCPGERYVFPSFSKAVGGREMGDWMAWRRKESPPILKMVWEGLIGPGEETHFPRGAQALFWHVFVVYQRMFNEHMRNQLFPL